VSNDKNTFKIDNKNFAINNKNLIMNYSDYTDENSITVKVPPGMSIIWIKTRNDRFTTFKVDGTPINTTGYRTIITNRRPEGKSDNDNSYCWIPLPFPINPPRTTDKIRLMITIAASINFFWQ
jgi:hypothetical protein